MEPRFFLVLTVVVPPCSARRWAGTAAAAEEGAADVQWSAEVTNSTDPWEITYWMRVDVLLNEVYAGGSGWQYADDHLVG